MTTYTVLCGLSGRMKEFDDLLITLKANCSTTVIDPLYGQRNSFWGKRHIPTKSLDEIVKETEKHFPDRPTYLFGWSFGALIAVLQKRCPPLKEVIFISPFFGGDTIAPTPKKIIFPFFPALRKAHSQEIQDKVFECLREWKNKGVKILFILPRNGDDKVVYTEKIINEMKEVGTVLFIDGVEKHEKMLQEPELLKIIKGELRN